MKEVFKIDHNWFYTPDGDGSYTYEIGKDNVKQIIEHVPRGEGDRWFYMIVFEDGKEIYVFNPNMVYKR